MAHAKGMIIGGIFMICIGITLFVISLALFPDVLRKATVGEILKNVLVDSFNSPRYDEWAGKNSIDNYFQQYYYAWNLTNPNQVIQGGKPKYESIGPFNYRYQWENLNVSFIEGGKKVVYSQKKTFTFDPSQSPNDPYSVEITNINPAYLGLMLQLDEAASKIKQFPLAAEVLLFIVGSGGQMKLFLEYFNSAQFNTVAYYVSNPLMFQDAFKNLNKSLQGSVPDPVSYIYEQWANATSLPAKGINWDGMLTSFNQTPSGITLDSALKIFDSSSKLSLLNEYGLNVWISSYLGDETSTSTLLDNIKLTVNQLSAVQEWWLNSLAPSLTNPYFLRLCGITNLDLLGVCQFINALPLQGRSINSLSFVGQPYTLGPIELSLVASQNFSVTPTEAQSNLFSGPTSILNINGVSEFMNASTSHDYSAWGLNAQDGDAIFGYILGGILPYSNQTIIDLYGKGGGIITTRTVDQWLWNCQDILLDFLGVEQNCGLQQNGTTLKPSTVFTGKNDTMLTNIYDKYQGQHFLTVWNGTVEVQGVTESGQFAPLADLQQNLTLFEENVLRPLNLSYAYDSSVQGIGTKRYYLANNSFPIDPLFYNSIPGFANLTSVQNLTAFVSLWDMYEVPANYSTDLIDGLSPSYENASIPLDLEPYSGNALSYNLKLQLNLLIPNNTWFSETLNYNNFPQFVFFPILKIGQTGYPSSSTINNLKNQFKELKALNLAPIIICAIFGGILTIVGVWMGIVGFRKLRQRSGYLSIQNEN
ncbi:hypothetical protein CYY_001362 [Polysphondylium violaceum]|uniref:Uncharacterized protein n=1 Tax=Polysphondylium violaceum TaxID=133409 RepID=A0A8J4Q214_9MYCE|nr:hypothetical protein CYY_001362 [Polysphondylium violaceum]